jgi:membrane protein implicated in regulation of membrane protease activity
MQWLLFSVLAIVSLLLFRNRLRARLKTDDGASGKVDALVGDLAVPLEPIAPGAVGRVEMRGAAWSARNTGPSPVTAGQRCRVLTVDGLLLEIRAE